jgi:hypothetical protein
MVTTHPEELPSIFVLYYKKIVGFVAVNYDISYNCLSNELLFKNGSSVSTKKLSSTTQERQLEELIIDKGFFNAAPFFPPSNLSRMPFNTF